MRALSQPTQWLGRLTAASLILAVSCTSPWNNPYPASEREGKNLYLSFATAPKTLDPAKSYYSHEMALIANVFEPPLDYHYLNRPYELIPSVAAAIPQPTYFDALEPRGKVIPGDPPVEQVKRTEYTIRLKPNTHYAPHPCFAKADDGSPYYANVTLEQLGDIEQLDEFEKRGTRTLRAQDFAIQIRRLADPRLNSPIYSTMKQYIYGLEETRKAIQAKVDAIKAERLDAVDGNKDALPDERDQPIVIDYMSVPCKGVEVIDELTYKIILPKKYPQMKYWLAMPFFAPMPQEAIDFYGQGPLIRRNITLGRFPVGTGAFRIDRNVTGLEIVMNRNERFRENKYPSEGEPDDRAAGLLADAGKQLPFADRAVWKLEKESLPGWNKFLQGYYDRHYIFDEAFQQAIQFGSGEIDLSDEMKEQGIALERNVQFLIYEFAFNMLDPVVGGYTPEKKKLRQAIAIAIDSEEFIQIFLNDRAVPAHGPIPPGIFGAIETPKHYNPKIYRWDEAKKQPVRKTLEDAKKLLAEAGYENGIGPDGKPLEITFDNAFDRADLQARIQWLIKKFDALGIRLVNKTTEHGTYREKLVSGNYQMIWAGWNNDYPDPENFLFLLYGPNSKVKRGGENMANYDNPKFNKLFLKMESMNNGPERQKVIDELVKIVHDDGPWAFMYHPEEYVLKHNWLKNVKPSLVTRNTLKYRRVNVADRVARQEEWNQPIMWPIYLVIALLAILVSPAIVVTRRNS